MKRSIIYQLPKRALLLLLLLFSMLTVQAQETSGGLTGQVLDSKNRPVPDATVTAVHQPSGTEYSISTRKDGRYNLNNLRVGGPYKVTVTFIGSQPQVMDNVQVALGTTQTLNFALRDNTISLNEVKINGADTAASNTYGAGKNINSSQIKNQPNADRSITQLTQLVPQASRDNSFGGSSFRYNNITIDGAINNDAIGFLTSNGRQAGTSGMAGSSTRTNPISLDALQSLQVYLSPYNITLGNFTGASINAVTRSGINEVTGSFYTLGRNAAVTGPESAGDGSKTPGAFHDYTLGATVGFPIVKNKLFFFSNEEITRRVDPVTEGAGSSDVAGILSASDAQKITDYLVKNYNFNPGTYGNFNTYANSNKFFNKLDWNINNKNQLSIRNNTVTSQATSLSRDNQDFRFGGIAYESVNTQSGTVAELKSSFSSALSNSLLVSYSTAHDQRNPLSNPAMPQIQIAGNTPGTMIYLGTDREASIFDMRQNTTEFTDNLTWFHGKHTFTFGTHNEFYNITDAFVNGWNSRVDYYANPTTGESGIDAFLNSDPGRVRGSYNYANNTRDYLLANPSAKFNVNFYSVYTQDEIRINNKLKITPSLRLDYMNVPTKPPLSYRTQNSPLDTQPDTAYRYTSLSQIKNSYLNNLVLSPRIGFSYDINGDNTLILRGGSGVFTSRIPFSWLAYSFYNNGQNYGYYDQKAGNKPFVNPGSVLNPTSTGIAPFVAANGQNTNSQYLSQTQIDVVDNNFKMPRVWRSSLALDYNAPDNWKFGIAGIYTKTIYDVTFTQVNYPEIYSYYAYDLKPGYNQPIPGNPGTSGYTLKPGQTQPIYNGTLDPNLTAAYVMGNTSQGYRYSITGSVAKRFPNGFNFTAAYTYGRSKDINSDVRNSMEGNWQYNQALNPNDPGLANSNFDLRNRIIASLGYNKNWNPTWTTNVNLFVSAQSGSPFTWGFTNYTVQNNGQLISLAYIPNKGETINFFSAQPGQSAAQQAAAFDQFIDSNPYLASKRGTYTARNEGRTPWNNDADFQLVQDYHIIGKNGKVQTISFTWTIMNLTNLVDKNWGLVYFSPDSFNSTASVGLIPYIPNKVVNGYPQYTFQNPGRPYSIDYFASKWQMQFGLRYTY